MHPDAVRSVAYAFQGDCDEQRKTSKELHKLIGKRTREEVR